jgi:uncharacterized SAM-binding protein YcdF (DUF218 family)
LIGLALRRDFRQLAAMIRGIFRLLLQLVTLVIVAFALTAGYIVFDGISDKGAPADCALVIAHSDGSGADSVAVAHATLDVAAKLYHDKKAPLIIVSGGAEPGFADPTPEMAAYLQAHGVSGMDIVANSTGIHTADSARSVAALMKARSLRSMLIVAPYYRITRTKLALQHAGLSQFSQAHSGTLVKEDAMAIVHETAALWYYIYQDNLQPTVAKLSVQAQAEAAQLKSQIQTEADKTKDTVQKDVKDK